MLEEQQGGAPASGAVFDIARIDRTASAAKGDMINPTKPNINSAEGASALDRKIMLLAASGCCLNSDIVG